ncbi:hypothetical protein CORC01_07283 [Colletotrichum orchidophilum]|uniref:Uncharacterized protein n=1 Tax=Colletotrichum orchidophilum TaxID=1209926 RepID=A0A1G4B7E9_9PEZI|nr:uncharacterized protein CORC01_07283 [Colletotrichum orchidophilum]OHE97378.1 hypothetical protein CORC01_07283 [Colletotrichum orchidophilum]
MPRRHRSSKRSPKHRHASLEPDFSLTGVNPVTKVRRRSRKDADNATGRHRPLHDSSRSPRRYRHSNEYSRHFEAKSDTDGDQIVLPTPPALPNTSLVIRTTSPNRKGDYTDTATRRQQSGLERRNVISRPPKYHTKETRCDQQPDEFVVNNYRFRNHILFLLEEQRTSVESWAHSVGAGGPAEPMDWQPEQERVIYIARDLVEYGCYEDRWRIGSGQQQEDKPTKPMVQSELVSWAGQPQKDGSTMCGAPALALGLVDGIE